MGSARKLGHCSVPVHVVLGPNGLIEVTTSRKRACEVLIAHAIQSGDYDSYYTETYNVPNDKVYGTLANPDIEQIEGLYGPLSGLSYHHDIILESEANWWLVGGQWVT